MRLLGDGDRRPTGSRGAEGSMGPAKTLKPDQGFRDRRTQPTAPATWHVLDYWHGGEAAPATRRVLDYWHACMHGTRFYGAA